MKNYEKYPIYDADGNKLVMHVIVFCPTIDRNPISESLKYLGEMDSSRCRAPAAVNRDWTRVDCTNFIKPWPPGPDTVAVPREDRARAVVEAGPMASTELRRGSTVPLRRTTGGRPVVPTRR